MKQMTTTAMREANGGAKWKYQCPYCIFATNNATLMKAHKLHKHWSLCIWDHFFRY